MREWTRSSACYAATNCVEVQWVKSSSCGYAQDCVEVGELTDDVLVRDGKDPDGPVLRFTRAEWDAFLAGVKAGEFDR